jgi:hypothetical protein
MIWRVNLPSQLLFDGEGEFFDHRIRKYLSRNTLDLRLRLVAAHAIQRENKIFALPDVCYALVIHLLQGALNGLSLRVQYGLLESDVNVSFHFRRAPLWNVNYREDLPIITLALDQPRAPTATPAKSAVRWGPGLIARSPLIPLHSRSE